MYSKVDELFDIMCLCYQSLCFNYSRPISHCTLPGVGHFVLDHYSIFNETIISGDSISLTLLHKLL